MDDDKRSREDSIFHRLWCWLHVGLFGIMIISGFEIHGYVSIFGFEPAIRFHKFGILMMFTVWPVAMVVIFLVKKNLANSRDVLMGFLVLISQVITGTLYLGHNYLETYGLTISLRTIAYMHTIGAFTVIVYMILNIYRSFVLPKMNPAQRAKSLVIQ